MDVKETKLTLLQKIIILLMFLTKYKTKIKIGDIGMLKGDLDWSDEQRELETKILNGGYISGYNKDYPKVTKDNICIDGNHRLTTLKKIKSDDYMVEVEKLWLLKWDTIYKMAGNPN